MIQLLQRGRIEPWTDEDIDIVVSRLRIPSLARAEYKLSDRKDAAFMFCWGDDRASKKATQA